MNEKKMYLPMLMTIGTFLLLLLLLFFLFATNLVVRQTQQRAFDLLELAAQEIVHSPSSAQKIVLRFASTLAVHIVVVDDMGFLLADSTNASLQAGGRYINAVITEARQKTRATSVVRDALRQSMSVSVAKRVETQENGGQTYIIAVRIQSGEEDRLRKFLLIWLALFVVVLLSLLHVLIRYTKDTYQKPILKLVQHRQDAAQYQLLIEANNKKYSRIFTMLANLPAGILMVEPDNTVVLANPKAQHLLCLDKRELFKDQKGTIHNNTLLARLLQETTQVNGGQERRNITLAGMRDEILKLSVERIYSKYAPYAHCGALVIIQDVTEMRRLEKLKDQFVANVSHELRTPLTVIAGFIETLQSWEKLSDSDRKSALRIIELETERLSKLIAELLQLSRIDAGVPETEESSFDPFPLVEEVLQTLDIRRREKKIELSMRFSEEKLLLWGVPSCFRQIVFNIFDNAVKYSPPGGNIELSLLRQKKSLVLTLSDSGPGIPNAERERVFERFYQINRSATSKNPGSGLGLSIAKEMAERFGGTIQFDSSQSGGAKITVVLPLEQESISD